MFLPFYRALFSKILCAEGKGLLEKVGVGYHMQLEQRHFYAEWTTTPLGFACFFGGEHLVEFLLQHDADPEIRNARGHTAFQLARGHSVLTLVLLETT